MTAERFFLQKAGRQIPIPREGDRWLRSSKIHVAIVRTSRLSRTRSSSIALRLNMQDSNMVCR
jgi:hypothetical protein